MLTAHLFINALASSGGPQHSVWCRIEIRAVDWDFLVAVDECVELAVQAAMRGRFAAEVASIHFPAPGFYPEPVAESAAVPRYQSRWAPLVGSRFAVLPDLLGDVL